MTRVQRLTSILLGVGVIATIVACQSNEKTFCPDGFVDTQNFGSGEPFICCPYGSTAQDGMCFEEVTEAQAEFEEPQQEVVVKQEIQEPVTPEIVEPQPVAQESALQAEAEATAAATAAVAAAVATQEEVADQQEEEKQEVPEVKVESNQATINPDDFIYLTAPNGKGSAYCPKNANSLAWNGVKFKCCGKGLKSVVVPSREDSLCCPKGTTSARWIGQNVFDYECCPEGTVEVKNEGEGDKYVCCLPGQIAKDGTCLIKGDIHKDGKVLMTALGNKGQAYCPENANSLAWDSNEFQCCGKGMKATLILARGDSICCPDNSVEARWVGKKWNDYECCPAGTVATKNLGEGDKYVCCPANNRVLNGDCYALR